MREILFRGKRIDNGEWAVGYLGVFKGVAQIYVPFTEEEEAENKGHIFSAIGGLWHTVDPATVGQYTGLTDKNGKRIFEGDIVEKDGVRMYVVQIRGSWQLWDHEDNEDFLWNWCSAAYRNGVDVGGCLVIGNIHDNPKLLNGGDAR